MEQQNNDYSLTLRVSQKDILETAQQFIGDTPLEVAENVWNELAETEITLPMQLGDLFGMMTRIVLGITLVGKLKFPDDETDRNLWTLSNILEGFFSLMMPGGMAVANQGLIPTGEEIPLPVDNIEEGIPAQIAAERFHKWFQEMAQFSVTPVITIGVSHGENGGELFLWPAETLTEQDVLSFLTHAWKWTVQDLI